MAGKARNGVHPFSAARGGVRSRNLEKRKNDSSVVGGFFQLGTGGRASVFTSNAVSWPQRRQLLIYTDVLFGPSLCRRANFRFDTHFLKNNRKELINNEAI